jgi:hypothetical protein
MRFAGVLQSFDCWSLEAEVGLELLTQFSNQSLVRQRCNQKIRALLVAPDLSQCDSSGSIAMLPLPVLRPLRGGFLRPCPPSCFARDGLFNRFFTAFQNDLTEDEMVVM